MISRLIKFSGFAVLILAGILLYNTFTNSSKQVQVSSVKPIYVSDSSILSLSEAVKIPTVSVESANDTSGLEPFARLIEYLKQTYPLSESRMEKKVIGQYSLLYVWKGKNPSLKPVIFMGHLDVVPAIENSGKKWEHPPFGGNIENGYVWGRGTMDDKVNVIGLLEAAEMLLREGFRPERTVYFAFGHDEETGGENGAAKIASYLKSNGIKAEFILDEGLLITDKVVPGIEAPVALIGIAEKGYVSLELSVTTSGGHSSMPSSQSAIGILSAAIATLESNPFPAKICEPVNYFMESIGPEMPFARKLIFSNTWAFHKLITWQYEASNSGNATVRTTLAPTLFHSGIKDNVLPSYACATLNFRILPGEKVQDVVGYVKKTLKEYPVQIKISGKAWEPSPVTDISTPGFYTVRKSIHQVFLGVLTVPALVIAQTDARHYHSVSENIFRFSPIFANAEDLKRIHGKNERISVENFRNSIRFYRQMIVNSSIEPGYGE